MKTILTREAEKSFVKLASRIRKKALKKFQLFDKGFQHPSLYSKKMSGKNTFEGRIDYHYRFTYLITKDAVYILTIGVHDEGLGKK
jgi:mRNA-degrading endonuclease RelE of RelBE toxin-antitoxin system